MVDSLLAAAPALEGRDADLLRRAGLTGRPEDLLPLLHFLQREQGYLSPAGVQQAARSLNLSASRVYGVASFYDHFRFQPPGEVTVRVCLGTACHVQGGEQLSRRLQERLGIRPGETTPDGRYALEEVACLGCCAQAAVVSVNGQVHGQMTPDQVEQVMDSHERV